MRANNPTKNFQNPIHVCRRIIITCRGVPVIKSRWSTFTIRTALLREEFSFLILCASSMMRYLHLIFASLLLSFNIPSYEVTRTSHLCFPVTGSTGKCSFSNFSRSSFVPPIRIARIDGHHFLNSLIQLPFRKQNAV